MTSNWRALSIYRFVFDNETKYFLKNYVRTFLLIPVVYMLKLCLIFLFELLSQKIDIARFLRAVLHTLILQCKVRVRVRVRVTSLFSLVS